MSIFSIFKSLSLKTHIISYNYILHQMEKDFWDVLGRFDFKTSGW